MTGLVKDLLCLLLLLFCCSSVVSEITCSGRYLKCSSVDYCVRVSYLCDGTKHCAAGEDEDPRLCEALKNKECKQGYAKCNRSGLNYCTDIYNYCTYKDPPCQGNLNPAICRMVQENSMQSLSHDAMIYGTGDNLEMSEQLGQEFRQQLNETMRHDECPKLFTLVGNQCVSFFFIGSVSWGEARVFCKIMGADLVVFNDVNHYASIAKLLKDMQMTADFWIGGRNEAKEISAWKWVNGEPMELGTPYWAIKTEMVCKLREVLFLELNKTRMANNGRCYNYIQAPKNPVSGQCAYLSYEHYYYMNDANCLHKKSPLCVYIDEA